MAANKKLSEAALRVLGTLDITKNSQGTTVRINAGQLDRKLYTEVNKALEALGGKWNRAAQGHVFTESVDDALEAVLLTGEFVDMKQLTQFYETPHELARKLVGFADIQVGMNVLEPSAGKGALLKTLDDLGLDRTRNPDKLHVAWMELDPKRFEYLKHLGATLDISNRGFQGDFLQFSTIAAQAGSTFDRVVMNPPFTRGQDAKHVRHAYELLKPGGKLVAIMSAGVKFRTTGDYTWVRERAHHIEDNPSGAFKESGTQVSTCIVVLNKPQ